WVYGKQFSVHFMFRWSCSDGPELIHELEMTISDYIFRMETKCARCIMITSLTINFTNYCNYLMHFVKIFFTNYCNYLMHFLSLALTFLDCRVYTLISKEKEFLHHEQVFHTDDPVIASFINVSALFNKNRLVLFFTSWFLTFLCHILSGLKILLFFVY
ncbi:hypothetical protein ACJX0J_007812, partial [Zea mays]